MTKWSAYFQDLIFALLFLTAEYVVSFPILGLILIVLPFEINIANPAIKESVKLIIFLIALITEVKYSKICSNLWLLKETKYRLFNILVLLLFMIVFGIFPFHRFFGDRIF